MAKCYNCANDAVHFVRDSWASIVDYCDACLPKSLRKRVAAGESFPAPKKAAEKASTEDS